MAMKDKSDECGCHKGCTWQTHDCANPCKWPHCLTDEEADQLNREIIKSMGGTA